MDCQKSFHFECHPFPRLHCYHSDHPQVAIKRLKNPNNAEARQADMATTAERWRQLDSLTK